MTDDHIRRFDLSENRPRKPFSFAKDQPSIKTKDNAQHILPPPRNVFVAHPRLAPPGMAGSRLAADASKELANRREESAREFKPLITKPEKWRGPDR